MRVLLLSAAIVGSTFSLAACNKDSSPTAPSSAAMALTGNLAFGPVTVNSTATQTLTISNGGTAALTVTGITFPSGFSGNWSGGTIAAGGSQPVVVTFAPTAATAYSGTITVTATQISTPATVTATGTGATAPVFTLSGIVTETPPTVSTVLAGARVTIIDGANAGLFAITDSRGAYAITGVSNGGYTVSVTLTGYVSKASPVGIEGNTVLNLQMDPTSARTSFGAGDYRVNADIPPGRYFTDPVDGCNFQRLSGFGGTQAEILGSAQVDFDAAQWIVDILSTDAGFHTDPNCGRWSTTAVRGAQSGITMGKWLVGSQVSPGTYRASANSGCYWERLSKFTSDNSAVIVNEFVSSPGTQLVTIASTDVGFSTNNECGAWTRVP
ncbi:MAG: choice-of-anchor D domain-containing protein [Vicinamibacterales bacterium]